MKVWLIRDILCLLHGGCGKDCAFLVFLVGCWCAGLIPYMFFDLIEVMFFGVVL